MVTIEWQISGIPCLISDKVTKECAICNNVDFLPIDNCPEKWVKNIIHIDTNYDREKKSSENAKRIQQKGFDIYIEKKKLEKVYLKYEK